MKKKITIAVDGYSSCGKSTLARDLAKELGYDYIDSGAMYRAVTLFLMRRNIDEGERKEIPALMDQINIDFRWNTEHHRNEIFLNGECVEDRIREMDVSGQVSWVSAIQEVRKKMVDMQRSFAEDKDVVMDGRDIGTVVFPDAELKIFVTASIDVRAKRRHDELASKELKVTFKEVKKNLADRDRIDSTRAISPLRKAADAVEIDNSTMTREEQLAVAMNLAEKRIKIS
ncbi:MAG: (d)CMP kinase [Bacteroidetes bacterium]|nr:(d)CMP kinase [Bacteroidota bacterium]